jgi:hypothetical protein
MQPWLKDNIGYVLPFFFVAVWCAAGYATALMSGWRLLARRFRTVTPFTGMKWSMQSAAMRWLTHYNNVLTVGADSEGLFLVPFFLFRVGHSPLFVPWAEINARKTKQLFFFPMVELRLGSFEQIPFTIRPSLAARLESAAGENGPLNKKRLVTSQPPPIG